MKALALTPSTKHCTCGESTIHESLIHGMESTIYKSLSYIHIHGNAHNPNNDNGILMGSNKRYAGLACLNMAPFGQAATLPHVIPEDLSELLAPRVQQRPAAFLCPSDGFDSLIHIAKQSHVGTMVTTGRRRRARG